MKRTGFFLDEIDSLKGLTAWVIRLSENLFASRIIAHNVKQSDKSAYLIKGVFKVFVNIRIWSQTQEFINGQKKDIKNYHSNSYFDLHWSIIITVFVTKVHCGGNNFTLWWKNIFTTVFLKLYCGVFQKTPQSFFENT